MKNQYYGDINDYRKYGILRILADTAAMTITMGWMLTEDDNRTDGKYIQYLNSPGQWRQFDPSLFDTLEQQVGSGHRDVRAAGEVGIIPGAIYYPALLTDHHKEREAYFAALKSTAKGSHLIFLDPDNGVEIQSVGKGKRNSCKFLYWDEVEMLYRDRFSLLIYQHFPRRQREEFIRDMAGQFHERTSIRQVMALQTSNVVFFLLPQVPHLNRLREASAAISKAWATQVNVTHFEY